MKRFVEDVGSDISGQRPSLLGLVAMLVFWATVLGPLLSQTSDSGKRLWDVAGLLAFLAIFFVIWLRLPAAAVVHLALALQAAIVLLLLAANPEQDLITRLFLVQCYEAAVVFTGRTRLVWVATLVALIVASLMFEEGLLHGLAKALVPMAAGIVIAMFAIVSRELEAAGQTSQRMVGDLEAAQRELRVYADQVDELAAIEERSRVAGKLEESVAGTLSNVLSLTGSARELLGEPDRAGLELERLQALTQQALAQMRAIITELRPAPPDAPGDSER